MDIRKQIEQYIEKYKFEIVSRTCDLIKIPSVNVPDDSGKPYGIHCARALNFCEKLCREKGLVTKNYDYRCLEAMYQEGQPGKRLVVATHADVVPVTEGNLYDPFAGAVYGDYIVGRGAVDDKGPLIASLYALAFFRECGIPLKNDIRLVFGSNEEAGMDDMEYYLARAGQPDWALSVDGDFPTDNGEKGQVTFTITAKKSAHVSLLRSRGTGQGLIHEHCESTIDNRNVTIGRTRAPADWSHVDVGQGDQANTPQLAGIANPTAYTILSSSVPVFEDPETDRQIRQLLADEHGQLMDIDFSHEIGGRSVFRVYRAETRGEDIVLSFDVRVPYHVDLQQVAERITAYAVEKGLRLDITRISKGYYQKPDQEIVAALTDLYNQETGFHEEPYVLTEGRTYTRLFDNGCGYGGGYRNEVKPFPAGHGSCHGLDEAHNIGVLLDAVKFLILGIKAIDDLWS